MTVEFITKQKIKQSPTFYDFEPMFDHIYVSVKLLIHLFNRIEGCKSHQTSFLNPF